MNFTAYLGTDWHEQVFGLIDKMPFKPSKVNVEVCVVIPFYNHLTYIADTLASLQHQTHKNFSVIIVNDGSDAVTKATLSKSFQMNEF